jgi:hypothetical protein
MKNKLVVIGFIFLAVVAAAAWLSSRGGAPAPAPAPTPTPIAAAPAAIAVSPFLPPPAGVSFSFVFAPEEFPTVLPLFAAQQAPPSAQALQAVASSLGFATPPTTTPIDGGQYYVWSNSAGASFSYQTEPPVASFVQEISLVGEAPTGEVASAVVLEFLQRYGLVDPSFDLALVGTERLVVNGQNAQPARGSAGNVVSVAHQLTISGFPLYVRTGARAGVSSLVGPQGAIRSVSLTLSPAVTRNEDVGLISVQSAMQALAAGRGILVDITGNTLTETTARASYTRVVVDAASLAYLEDPAGVLRPVFVFGGSATGGGQTVRVAYMLSATP